MIKAENFVIADSKEAEEYGFCIEGDVCFIFELGHYAMGCLGFGDGGRCRSWRFDTIDHEGTPYSFTENKLSDAIQRAQAIAKAVIALEQVIKIDNKIFASLLCIFKCV